MNRIHFTMFMLTVSLVLVLSAISIVPVLADDSVPPPTETPITVETIPMDVATEVPVANATIPVEPSSVVVPASQNEAGAAILPQVPEGTDLVVVNAKGETIPLVTQEASTIINTNDPVWCPTGVAPKTDGTGGCTTSYGNLKLLMDALMNGTAGVVPGKSGVIWIEASNNITPDNSGGPIMLDGADTDLGSMETFSLTLQGGWNGTSGSKTITGISTFNQSISIIGWKGDVTLSNITISGVTLGSVTNSAALDIQTTKKITLTNVNVKDNTGTGVNGVWLDNEDGDPLVLGDVLITNSQFNNNKKVGLTVNSEGLITLAGVLVDGNQAGGATLSNQNAITAKAVTITAGTNEFSNNLIGGGLNIASTGIITLKDVNAVNNSGDGIYLDNRFGNAVGITLSGTTIASENDAAGLTAHSDGAITASNIIANSNGGWGASLDNSSPGTAQSVKLTGSNEFKFNGGGLLINSNGAIALNNVTANNNDSNEGANLNNTGSLVGAAVAVTGTNNFKGNYSSGIYVRSNGTITLNNVSADNNGTSGLSGSGADLDNSTSSTSKSVVTLTGINEFNNNIDAGLLVLSDGKITINNLTANLNQNGHGASLDNTSSGTASPQNISLTGNTVVNNNNGSGLFVQTYGPISLGNITANNNGDTGASLDNSTGTLPKTVTLSGTTNEFHYNNAGSGLYILSLGAIMLNNIHSTDNGGNGLYVDNSSTGAVGGVTLNGTNELSNNFSTGIELITKGAIKINNLDASFNSGIGASIDNTFSNNAFPQNVTINGSNNFNGNDDTGLVISTYGTITLNNITASDNGGWGLYADNHSLDALSDAITAKSVTLTGINVFNSNAQDGLFIDTLGLIKANNLTASTNGANGAVLNNQWDFGSFGITLTGSNLFEHNSDDGLSISSNGAVTINNLSANLNTGDGAFVDAYNNISAVAKVTLTGNNYFIHNGDGVTSNGPGNGLIVWSDTVITINNLTANENTESGAVIYGYKKGDEGNHYWPLLPAISLKLSGVNTFSDNGADGLFFYSPGTVDITKLTADNNGDDGIEGHSEKGNITISCGSMTNNVSYGWNLELLTIGKLLTLKGVFAFGNTAGNTLQTGGTLVPVRTCTLP